MTRRFHLAAPPVLYALISLGFYTTAAFADLLPIAWDGGAASEFWSAPLNWDLDVVPDDGATDQYDVTIAAADVTLDQDATISGLSIGAAATLSIGDGFDLSLQSGGTFSNSNVISLDSTGNFTQIIVSGGDLTLTGGGVISLTDFTTNLIRGAVSTDRLTNEDNMIQGAGGIGANTMALTNRGTIIADGANALTIDPNANGAINSGIIKAAAGATLKLNPGTYTNAEGETAGQIIAEDGGTVQALVAHITGGIIEVQGAGILQMDDTTLTDLALINSSSGVISIVDATSIDADVTNPVGGTIAVADGETLTLASTGTYDNAGDIVIESAGALTYIMITGGDLTISGGGTISLTDFAVNFIRGLAITDRLINEDNTIQGAGNIGVNAMALTNRGTIAANATQTLTVDPSSGGAINKGTMKAAPGGTLALNGGNYVNREGGIDGRIVAEDGGTVRMLLANITGGEIEVQGGGVLTLDDTTIAEATITNSDGGTITLIDDATLGDTLTNPAGGSIVVTDGNKLTVASGGPYTNDGDISLESTGAATWLYFNATTTLFGSGTITLSDSFSNAIVGAGGTTFTNAGNTIEGAGVLGASSSSIVNQGIITADGATLLRITPGVLPTGFDNQGSLNATGAGGLLITSGGFTTSGQVLVAEGSGLERYGDFTQTAGSTIVNGEFSATGAVSITGMLGGGGTMTANVTHLGNGAVSPGASTGQLTIEGTYAQAASTILEIELGGTAPGEFDVLAITGNATIGGVLTVSLVDGFFPEAGQTFEILTAAGLSGTFASIVPVNVPSPLTVSESYQSDRVILTIGATPGLGACCHGDGACEVIDQGSCDLPDDVFTLGAPCSPLTCPELVECCVGDVNGDQMIDSRDIDGFVAGLLDPPLPGTIPFCRLDVNEDRFNVDINDVVPFVALLIQGATCEIVCCPGDLNGDNLLNGSDIAPLQDAIDNPPPRGTIEFCRADVNEDLFIDNADASALALKLLMGETCPDSELSLQKMIEEAR